MRQHLVESAAFWYDASKRKQRDGDMDAALMAMEQAYNAVENALAEERQERLREAAMRIGKD